jgi:hypothetical protein
MTAPGQSMVRDSEIFAPARVDMKLFLSRLSTGEQVKEQQELNAAYDRACLALIGPNDIQVEGDKTFKKKSAWTKLARYFTISTAVVNVLEKFVPGAEGESIFIAIVTVRAVAPWGQYSEAVGACATDEETGQRVITIADALATAQTRASNRSVSNLIAMGEVSAEEIQKGNGSTAGNSDMKRAEKDPGEFRMPFGKTKGKKLSELAQDDLEGAYDWAVEKNKFDDFRTAAKAYLNRLKNPPKQEAPAAAPADPTTPKPRSTSHPVQPPGQIADALTPDPSSVRAMHVRIQKALESPAISPETRQAYADANINGFRPPKHKSIEWWVHSLEEIAARDQGEGAEDPDRINNPGLNDQLDDLF